MTKTNLTRIEISKCFKQEIGISELISKKIIDDLLDIFSVEIKNNNLNLKNFGSFKLIHKKKRLGRNPKTKERFIISERKSISFSASKKLLKDINDNE